MLRKLTRRLLMGMGVIFSVTIVAWMTHAEFGHSFHPLAIPVERNTTGTSLDNHAPQAIDADANFEMRARATEEGFFSAFPFHS